MIVSNKRQTQHNTKPPVFKQIFPRNEDWTQAAIRQCWLIWGGNEARSQLPGIMEGICLIAKEGGKQPPKQLLSSWNLHFLKQGNTNFLSPIYTQRKQRGKNFDWHKHTDNKGPIQQPPPFTTTTASWDGYATWERKIGCLIPVKILPFLL